MEQSLSGQCILLTREFTHDYTPLKEAGAELFEFPTIEIVPPDDYAPLDEAIANIETYHWLIFTSANAFRYFIARFTDKGGNKDILANLKICAIGPRTADAIAERGLKVDLMPDEYNADGLILAFLKEAKMHQDPRYKFSNLNNLRILMPRADNAREGFPEIVTDLGGEIDCPVAYRSIMPEVDKAELYRRLKSGSVTIATFTSAATFNNLLAMLGDEANELLKDVTIAAIGPVTAKAIEAAGFRVAIMPKRALISEMVQAIIAKAEIQ
jgi:uroporphyrinogen III methyltransferase/synthase